MLSQELVWWGWGYRITEQEPQQALKRRWWMDSSLRSTIPSDPPAEKWEWELTCWPYPTEQVCPLRVLLEGHCISNSSHLTAWGLSSIPQPLLRPASPWKQAHELGHGTPFFSQTLYHSSHLAEEFFSQEFFLTLFQKSKHWLDRNKHSVNFQSLLRNSELSLEPLPSLSREGYLLPSPSQVATLSTVLFLHPAGYVLVDLPVGLFSF